MIRETPLGFPCRCSIHESVTGQLSKTRRVCTVGFPRKFPHKCQDPRCRALGSCLGVQQPAMFRLPPPCNPWFRGNRSLMQFRPLRNVRQPTDDRSLCAPTAPPASPATPKRPAPRPKPSPPRPRPIAPRLELAPLPLKGARCA